MRSVSCAVFFVLAAGLGFTQPSRLPVPPADEVEQSEKLVRELYKADLAKKKPAELVDAARKMMKAGNETKDNPAAKFVLYREASDLAARAGDLGTALEAGAGLIQHFEMKPAEVQLGILESADRGKVVPARAVAEAAMEVADDALRADDFAMAAKLLKLASTAASRASLTTLGTTITARMREAEAQEQFFKQLAADRKKLETDANDAGANFKVGKFLAVMKGDWDAALQMLAKGSDERWKAAAELEAALPVNTEARVALADRWFDLASTLEGVEALEVRFHAYQWYSQALADLSGLTKTRVEKRLLELEKSPDFKSARGTGWRVLFRSADPSIWNMDVNRGRYQFAIPVAKAPAGVRFLRMVETAKGTSVIIEMTKERLDQALDKDGYGWNGQNEYKYMAHHLGVYDMATGTPKGSIGILAGVGIGHRGWGFGNRAFLDDVQGYAWGGEQVPRTVFEIAVKVGPLTADESKRLLKKKK